MAKKRSRKHTSAPVFPSVGLLLFLCAYPFFLHNHYFKMTIGKTYFFYGATVFFVFGCIVSSICRQQFPQKQSLRAYIRGNPAELFLALFLFAAVISCAASVDPHGALTGENGRYMGLVTLLFIGFAYYFIAHCGRLTHTVAAVFGVSVAVMCTVSFLQFCGFDPFGLFENTQPTVRVNFMSLVGNKDVYYSYLALAVPFAMYAAFGAKERKEAILWPVVVFFGFIGVFACNSEGAYIGILPAFLLLFFLFCRDKQGLATYVLLLTLFFAAGLPVALTKSAIAQFGIAESFFMRTLLRPWICAAGSLVCAAAYAVVRLVNAPPLFYKILRIAGICAVSAAAAAVVGAFVWFTFIDRETDIGSFSEFLRYDSLYWGNKRAYVWSRLWQLYREFPLYRKLIGYGEETVEMLMQQNFKEEMYSLTGMNFDNAHNEFLQYLMTHGLLGLLFYLLFAVSAVLSALRRGGRYQKAAALSCVCYLAQSSVNIMQSITTPLFFVFVALTQTEDLYPPEDPSPAKNTAKTPAKAKAIKR